MEGSLSQQGRKPARACTIVVVLGAFAASILEKGQQ
jgi:hypothetical protein